MRIWSFHPSYLDAKGLVALWRETLLAKHVLLGKTKGYRHHPQLRRFQQQPEPTIAIDHYLAAVYHESLQRGYRFNPDKFDAQAHAAIMTVTNRQLAYERQHLLQKLATRSPKCYQQHQIQPEWQPHPLFRVIDGDIADWEIRD